MSAAPSQPAVLDRRRAGILLHPTSLPGPREHGGLGAEARRFIEFLAAAGVSVWQVLPLGPTHADGSPYQCLSAHAGNPALIDVDDLRARGWLPPEADPSRHAACLARAWEGFQQHARAEDWDDFKAFRHRHRHWLEDFALFMVLRQRHPHGGWADWPRPLRDRQAAALQRAREENAEAIELQVFIQYLFFAQWQALRDFARERGIRLFGDMPIFVAWDSADVWVHRDLFKLDAEGRPEVVAGVPPDYFSPTGQRWGNPHYHWERMEEDGFRWWIERMGTQLELFDLVRIDHFRGFEACWEIPATDETAEHGWWAKAPGEALLSRLFAVFGQLPLVAEDLGIITPEVEALRDRFGLPGMKILQFAFDGGPENPYLPHNGVPNSVIYTGTHDNDTTLGWYRHDEARLRPLLADYLGCEPADMPWPLIRLALASVSRLAVLPLQDVLALGSEHRMNTPGTTEGNWRWRFTWDRVPEDAAGRLRHLVRLFGRLPA